MADAMTLDCAIDHLVVVAPSLDAGAQYVFDTLGVAPDRGGEHARMGTHNRLLKLGPALYLEVVAADPSVPRPQRPRWFDLDRLAPDALPRLATWVVRTSDIETARTRSGVQIGDIEPMTRGSLSWRITIPRDGTLTFDGVMPALIQWNSRAHPAAGMADHGCTLVQLEGEHAEASAIRDALRALGIDSAIALTTTQPGAPASLTALIDAPNGRRVLS